MLIEPSNLEKLWNKGIDITVGVITSVVSAGTIAIIATLTWDWKRKRDLKFEAAKEAQRHRLEDEHIKKRETEEARIRRDRLKKELAPHVTRFKSVAKGPDLALAMKAYQKWLEVNNLEYVPANQQFIHLWGNWQFESSNDQNTANQLTKIIPAVENTAFE